MPRSTAPSRRAAPPADSTVNDIPVPVPAPNNPPQPTMAELASSLARLQQTIEHLAQAYLPHPTFTQIQDTTTVNNSRLLHHQPFTASSAQNREITTAIFAANNHPTASSPTPFTVSPTNPHIKPSNQHAPHNAQPSREFKAQSLADTTSSKILQYLLQKEPPLNPTTLNSPTITPSPPSVKPLPIKPHDPNIPTTTVISATNYPPTTYPPSSISLNPTLPTPPFHPLLLLSSTTSDSTKISFSPPLPPSHTSHSNPTPQPTDKSKLEDDFPGNHKSVAASDFPQLPDEEFNSAQATQWQIAWKEESGLKPSWDWADHLLRTYPKLPLWARVFNSGVLSRALSDHVAGGQDLEIERRIEVENEEVRMKKYKLRSRRQKKGTLPVSVEDDAVVRLIGKFCAHVV